MMLIPPKPSLPPPPLTLLDLYIEISVFRVFGLVACGLTALFSLLEFVEQLSSVGQGHYRLIDALVYVLLTVPSRLLKVIPVSMLLGCLLALGALARSSELIALRSLGFSERRIIGSVLKLVPPIVVALFLIAEFVVPPAQQLAHERRAAALSSATSVHNGDDFWAQGDHQFLNVRTFKYGNVPTDIEIYTLAEDGRLANYIHADRGDIQPDGTWLLTGVLRKSISNQHFYTEHPPSLSWRSFMLPEQTRLLTLPPESMPPTVLYRYVRDLARRHQQAIRYEQELWAKIDIPLSLIAMIVTAAPFVFGSPRQQNTGQQITIGAILGIVFSLSQQIADRLDLLLNLNPAATTLAPSLLFIGLAIYLFRRTYRPHGRLDMRIDRSGKPSAGVSPGSPGF